jgi:16S rRNA processing protein RimM
LRGDARVEIGVVARAHGIRGEVAVVTHDPDSRTLATVSEVFIDNKPHAVEDARPTPKGWLVALAGVTTRDAAEALRGRPVAVDRTALQLAEDDVLLSDLVGCRVVLADGTPYGEIAAIDVAGQDRLVIHDNGVERLVPLVDAFVTNIDLDAGIVTVVPPEGLPEEKLP